MVMVTSRTLAFRVLALLPIHSPEVGLCQSTMCRSLLLDDETVGGALDDLPQTYNSSLLCNFDVQGV
jgi:hypothetical protein